MAQEPSGQSGDNEDGGSSNDTGSNVPAAPVPPPLPREPIPAIPISEPGVVSPPPFAEVYSPPPGAGMPTSMTMTPPQPGGGYYPPAYPAHPPDYRGYMPAGPSRPGIITFLGVVSIVVAGLSLFSSIFSGCSGLVALKVTENNTAYAGPPVVPGGPAIATAPATVGDGLDAADRRAVLRALQEKRPSELSSTRYENIDNLLANYGKVIIASDAPITAEGFASSIGATGREYGSGRPDYFVLKPSPLVIKPGRLRVTDDRASFRPDDGSNDLYSGATVSVIPSPSPNAIRMLSSDQVEGLISRISSLGNNRLNSWQVGSLRQQFNSPQYAQWITPATTVQGVTSQVTGVTVRKGVATINFSMATIRVDSAGVIRDTGGNIVAVGQGGGGNPMTTGVSVDRSSCGYVIAEAILSVILAVGLLVAGILTLRQSALSRWFLLGYAGLKLLCGIGGIVALALMIKSVTATDDFVGAMQMGMVAGWGRAALMLTCVGLVYPLVVLGVLLGARSVREYYRMA